MKVPKRAARHTVSLRWRERVFTFGLYAGVSAAGHLLWEIVQLPLYSLWQTASHTELAFAVLHCTGGDFLIALNVLLASVVLLRAWSWPRAQALQVASLSIPLGIAYTAYSEWLNIYVRQSWGYRPAMPTVKILSYQIGVSPLAQWLLVPAAVFAILASMRRWYVQSEPGAPEP
ncbi:MAG: hypothetical protein R3D51_11165 [Hyphomicrobiaceae bacterium]